jgi:diguanylate cyclase
MIIDIDFFKSINDSYGHIVGDTILKSIAKVLYDSLRKGDCIGRMGGEEFLIVLPSTKLDNAKIVGEKIRTRVENSSFSGNNYNNLKVTISIGIAENDLNSSHWETLLENADKALYEAKNSGRNKVAIYKNHL